jgi:hypothetical protein
LATGAYNALGESVQIVTEDFDKYQFVAVAEDGVGEMGVGYQVGGGLSVQSTSILRTILDTVTFDPTGIAFTGSVIADENNTTNYYTLATTDPNLSRLQVIDLIENSPTSVASIGSNISANSNVVTDSILTQVVDVNSSVYSATAVNKAYVYTYAIDVSGSNNHRDIDMKEFVLATEIDDVYPIIREVADITENNLTLVNGSIFSSVTSITKYYVVAFLSSAPSGDVVDVDTIDETSITAFVSSLGVLSGTGYKTLLGATGNNVYYNEDSVAQYAIENISNITVASAFRTLTPTATDGSEMIAITTTGHSFTTCIITEDALSNVSVSIHEPTTQSYNNRSIFYEQDQITPETMTSYTDYAIKNKFLFTYTSSSIKVWRMDTSELVSVHTSTTPSAITSIRSMIDLPHVVYTYNSGGFTQFRILTVDIDTNTIIANTDSVMSSGVQMTAFMLNDHYFIGKSTSHVGVYTFDQINIRFSFMESFDTFTYDSNLYTMSTNYVLSRSKFVGKNKFVMVNTTDKSVFIFQFNGTSWNNVSSSFILYHTDGTSQYISTGNVVHSYDGNYLFIGGNSTFRKGYQTGMFYVYRWNGSEYINTGFIDENNTVYNHFTVDMSVTMDNRLMVLDYAVMSSSGGSLPERSILYGYDFNKDAFDFGSSTIVYYGNPSNTHGPTRIFRFFTDFYSTVFMKQNQSPRILYFREMYDVTDVRPYPPRGWTNGALVTSSSANMNVVESGVGINLINTGYPSTMRSTWTLPASYVTYGVGEYVATTNSSYPNGGHYPAGAFTKLHLSSPCFHSNGTIPSVSSPLIFGIKLPVSIILKRYDTYARNELNMSIKTWKLQASNDNFATEIIDLDSQTGQTIMPAKYNSYDTLTNTTSYNSYRLRITAINSTSCVVSEFELWGIEQP